MRMKRKTVITNLNEFVEWTGQFNNREYLFRGVSASSYIKKGTIEASISRRLQDEDKKPDQAGLLEITRELIEKARLLGHGQRDGQDLSDLDLLAELQHFGAATCLIDFTYNALVALWFACWQVMAEKQEKCPENGKVVVLRSDGLEPLTRVDYHSSKQDIDYFFKPDKTARYPLYQWQPKHQNNRIIAQQSVFVFGLAPIEIAAECEIEANSKKKIQAELEALSGISSASLFSDFDGFAWLHAHDKPHFEPTAKAYRLRGIDAHQTRNMERAIDYLDLARGFEPENYENYIHLGRAYRSSGNLDLAVSNYNKAIELNPESAEAYNALGIAYTDNDEFDEAISACTKAIELNPRLAKAYNNRGNAYVNKGEFDKAIDDYNKTIGMRPDYVAVYCNIGETKMLQEEWDEVRKNLTTAKELGVNIIYSFQRDYKSVEAFEQKTCICVPPDIAAMLTPT